MDSDKQRRWWFATHPEFSRSRKGSRPRRDTQGTGTQRISGLPAADSKAYDQYEDALDRMDDYVAELHERIRKGDEMGLEADPHTALDLVPVGRFLMAPVQGLKGLLWRLGRGAVVSAVKKGSSGGPGKWKEIRRSPLGLEHQSRMSGQPIRHEDGKFYINEYEVHVEGRREPVRFDDFKDGVYYEYKGKQGNLIGKDGFFGDWCRAKAEAREEAERQVEAAQGLPLIWRVGADQVAAFKKAIGKIRGLLIKP